MELNANDLLNQAAEAFYKTVTLLTPEQGLTVLQTADVELLKRVKIIATKNGNVEFSKLLKIFIIAKGQDVDD